MNLLSSHISPKKQLHVKDGVREHGIYYEHKSCKLKLLGNL